jgi:hypothetical protein
MASLITRFSGSSGVTPVAHPSCSVSVSQNFKIVGGGANIVTNGPGNFLTASYPADHRTWNAAGKDHKVSSPGTINAYAYGIDDPNDVWDVKIVKVSSISANQPSVIAILPPEYALTGGGAFVDYHGAGNILTCSRPHLSSLNVWDGWEARSKDHKIADPAVITAYAIGIKLRSAPHGAPSALKPSVVPKDSNVTAHPFQTSCVSNNLALTGGGVIDDWNGFGNLLTGSGPDAGSQLCWTAKGQDHLESSPAKITVYAIGFAL